MITARQWSKAEERMIRLYLRRAPTVRQLLDQLAATREADQRAREKRAMGGGA